MRVRQRLPSKKRKRAKRDFSFLHEAAIARQRRG
jgi:hypothetical protein